MARVGVGRVRVRDEASAGIVVDASAQLTGGVGARVATLGPELTTLVSGVASDPCGVLVRLGLPWIDPIQRRGRFGSGGVGGLAPVGGRPELDARLRRRLPGSLPGVP